MSKKPDLGVMGVTFEIAQKYSSNLSMTAIKKELGLYNEEEVKRHIRKALSWFVDNYDESIEDKGKVL